jgi:2-oxoglutarate dehydrogenase E1 component
MRRESELEAEPSASNLAFVEGLYFRWLRDPAAVPEAWRGYFERWGSVPASAGVPQAFPARDGHAAAPAGAGGEAFQARADRLVQAYREDGHLFAAVDPLGLKRHPEHRIALADHGLSEADLGREIATGGGAARSTLRDLVAKLEETYCRTLGVELGHIHDAELRSWLEQRMERTRNRVALAPEVKRKLLGKLIEADCSRPSWAPSSWGRSASRSRAPTDSCRSSSSSSTGPWATACATSSSAWRTAGGSTCSPTPSANPWPRSSPSSGITPSSAALGAT